MSGTWSIVLHYTGLDDTRACLRSLIAQTKVDHRILVVDNASDDDCRNALGDEFPNVEFLRNNANMGWAGGNNVGIRHALKNDAKCVVLINNDAVAHPSLIASLDAAGDRHPEFGVLGPIVRDLEPPQDVQTDGFIFNDPEQPGFFSRRPCRTRSIEASEAPEVVPTDVVMGCCLWMRREAVEGIGFIDERFFLIHEESDYCLRAAAAGFRVGIVMEELLLHRRGTSFVEAERRTGRPWQAYFDVRNTALLLRKHAGKSSGRRGRWGSWREFLLHAYYYHSDAVERGEQPRARAIAEGLADAVTGRWGPYRERWRPLATLVDLLLGLARRIRRPFGQSRQVAILAPMKPPGADREK